MSDLPNIHFGEVDEKDTKAEEAIETGSNEQIDDEDSEEDEDKPASEELIELLGFNPDEESEDLDD